MRGALGALLVVASRFIAVLLMSKLGAFELLASMLTAVLLLASMLIADIILASNLTVLPTFGKHALGAPNSGSDTFLCAARGPRVGPAEQQVTLPCQ
jgi:prepilin signal peptidase PulO-like enzyme (type II secretory pathway)